MGGGSWGGRHRIELKIFSNSIKNDGFSGAKFLQNYWNATDSRGEVLGGSDKLDLDEFNEKPSLQIYGDWSEAYPEVLSQEISLVGKIGNYDHVFSCGAKFYKYEDVDIACNVNADAGDLSYVDLQDDELDLAKRDGVSAWVKGFGGNSRADDSSVLYNDYSLSAYGTSFGVDVALSETFQIGAYGNYGDLNVNQRSGETGGGSWNPEGWGGGLTAQYSTRNFYLQGLLGASEFSGEQSRNILDVADGLGGNTAKGDKTVTSYLGALRVGAPFKSGGVLLEPQGQVVWSQNDEQGFSENHGTEKNLRLKYKNRTTNFVETQLGLKLSVPIRTGDRSLLVPSLRAAWVADWDMGNEAQEIGYKFTKKTVDFDSDLESQNGALIEAGLDYTIQNHNSTAWKIYGRGGVELWDSDRGATWRASGGVTFQF